MSKQLEQQAQSFADKVMGMNRADRRAFARKNKMQKIYGSNKPYARTTGK